MRRRGSGVVMWRGERENSVALLKLSFGVVLSGWVHSYCVEGLKHLICMAGRRWSRSEGQPHFLSSC